MLAPENSEVTIEEGAKCLEKLVGGHLLLDVIGSVNQVIKHLLLDHLVAAVFFALGDDLLDLVLRAEARPQDQFKFTEHQKLHNIVQ